MEMNKQTEAFKVKYTEQQLRIIALQETVKLFQDCSKYDRGDVIQFAKCMLSFLEKGK